MQEINSYIHNNRNQVLIENDISERTMCECIKEYLDERFIDSSYSIDLEYDNNVAPNRVVLKKEIDYNKNELL